MEIVCSIAFGVFAAYVLIQMRERKRADARVKFWQEQAAQWESLFHQMSAAQDKTYNAAQSLSESHREAIELIDTLTKK